MPKNETGMTGAEELRAAVKALSHCNETFLDEFTAEQLLKLWRAWRACGWDYFPDQWTREQVRAAIYRGVVPEFSDPNHPTVRRYG